RPRSSADDDQLGRIVVDAGHTADARGARFHLRISGLSSVDASPRDRAQPGSIRAAERIRVHGRPADAAARSERAIRRSTDDPPLRPQAEREPDARLAHDRPDARVDRGGAEANRRAAAGAARLKARATGLTDCARLKARATGAYKARAIGSARLQPSAEGSRSR